MAFPEAFFIFWIFVSCGVLARPTKDENVLPAVGIEVVSGGKKIVGVTVGAAELSFIP